MTHLTSIQYAWIIYFVGCFGCTLAVWWMFLGAWRFVRYSAVVTVITILFTPYAIDAQNMTMAPAIYTLIFEGMAQGKQAIMPLIKLMIGIWLIAIILIAVFIALTRHNLAQPDEKKSRNSAPETPLKRQSRRLEHHDGRRHENPIRTSSRGLSREEYQAREELLKGEIPIHALRD